MSDTESDSLESQTAYDGEEVEPQEEEEKIETLRSLLHDWKVRELQKNTSLTANPRGLVPLQTYLAKAAKLYYDVNDYIENQGEKEENEKDNLYRQLRDTIGTPTELSTHQRILIHRLLERDLIEFPLTVDPKVVNTYTKKGYSGVLEFLEEE